MEVFANHLFQIMASQPDTTHDVDFKQFELKIKTDTLQKYRQEDINTIQLVTGINVAGDSQDRMTDWGQLHENRTGEILIDMLTFSCRKCTAFIFERPKIDLEGRETMDWLDRMNSVMEETNLVNNI